MEGMEDLSRFMIEAGRWVKSCCCCGEEEDDDEDKERSGEDEGDDKDEVSLRISRSWASLPPDEVSVETSVSFQTKLAPVGNNKHCDRLVRRPATLLSNH